MVLLNKNRDELKVCILLWEQFLTEEKPDYYCNLKIREKYALMQVPSSHPIVTMAFSDFLIWYTEKVIAEMEKS